MILKMKLAIVFVLAAVSASVAPAAEEAGAAAAAKPAAPESFQIRNKKFGELLRPQDANGADGTRIVLYPAQAWKCMTWKLHPVEESVFQLQNHFTSKTFAAEAKAEAVQPGVTQVPFGKDAPQRPAWKVTKLADGTCKLEDVKSGKVLTAVKEEKGSGAKVVVTTWEDKDEQKWELIKIDPRQLTM